MENSFLAEPIDLHGSAGLEPDENKDYVRNERGGALKLKLPRQIKREVELIPMHHEEEKSSPLVEARSQ